MSIKGDTHNFHNGQSARIVEKRKSTNEMKPSEIKENLSKITRNAPQKHENVIAIYHKDTSSKCILSYTFEVCACISLDDLE